MKLIVERYGCTPEQLQQIIDFKFIEIKDGMKVLGKETQEVMRQKIDETRQRDGGTGNLKKAIEVYEEKDCVGIGKISDLNIWAPYWYLINYGGYTTLSARGLSLYGYYGTMISQGRPRAEFRGANMSGGRGATEKFTPIQGGYRMTPTAPIWPHNYIEKTANWLSTVFKVHFYNWTKTTKVHTT